MLVKLPSGLTYQNCIPIAPFRGGEHFPAITFSTQCPLKAVQHGLLQLKRSHWNFKKCRFEPQNFSPVEFGFIHAQSTVYGRIGEIQVKVIKPNRVQWVIFTCENNSVRENRIRACFELENNALQWDQAEEIICSIYNIVRTQSNEKGII